MIKYLKSKKVIVLEMGDASKFELDFLYGDKTLARCQYAEHIGDDRFKDTTYILQLDELTESPV